MSCGSSSESVTRSWTCSTKQGGDCSGDKARTKGKQGRMKRKQGRETKAEERTGGRRNLGEEGKEREEEERSGRRRKEVRRT